MYVAKNGALIEDSQKQAFDFISQVYKICNRKDEMFIKVMNAKFPGEEEKVEEMLEMIKKLEEII